jgi:flagellar motor switch protein FliM
MSDQFLSQNEVDALLEGVNGEANFEPEIGQPGAAQSYDLSKSERVVRDRLPVLEVIHERFSRHLRTSLQTLLRRPPEVSAGAVKIQKYADFTRALPSPASLNLMGLQPLRGQALVVIDPSLVFATIDCLFGGSGKLPTKLEGREFSPTEVRLIARLLAAIEQSYAAAWASTYPLKMEHLRSEMLLQMMSFAAPTEPVVSASFAVEIGAVGGHVHLALPFSSLEPIRGLLNASAAGEAPPNDDNQWRQQLSQSVADAQVALSVELTQTQLTVGELMSLGVGDFLALPLQRSVQAKVDNIALFECHYGTCNGHYSVRIERSIASNTTPGLSV